MRRTKVTRKSHSGVNDIVKRSREPAREPLLLWESKTNRILLLGLILAVAAFLRLYRLDSVPPALHADEAMNGNLAEQILETHEYKVFYTENNGTEGLYTNLLVPLVALGGNTPGALRMGSALAGILTVWGIYFLGAE